MENGFFHPRKMRYVVNDTIEFECYQGFDLIGSQKRTCLRNGRWSGRSTICDGGETFCQDPGIPLGGSRRGNRFEEGDGVTYYCFSEFVLRGSSSRRCDSAGRWLGIEATCELPFSYDEPRMVAESLTLSEEILEHARQGTHLYFVVDASGSVGTENFQKTQMFIEAFSEMTDMISGRMKYYVLIFASKVLFERSLSIGSIDKGFFEDFNYTSFENQMGTNIGGALRKVLESINQTMQEKRRAGVQRQIILLITDGRHNVGPSPPDVVQKIKETVPDPDRNLDIFTIGIGDASKEELEKLTTNKEEPHSYYFRSYDQLEELTELIQNRKSDHVGCGVRGQSRRTRSVGRIYGGEKAEEKQWPWQVSIIMATSEGDYAGGGSIISPTWILTAAHNMFDDAGLQLEPPNVKVYVGTLRSQSGSARHVTEIHVHRRYNQTDAMENENYSYDIALLRLNESLTFSVKIRPVCLPCTKEVTDFLPAPAGKWQIQCTYQDRILTGFGGSEPREVTGYVSGWGVTERGKSSRDLNYGLISIKSRDQCQKDDLDDSQFCAKGDGVDSCAGDSGGPFAARFRQRWIQLGIVSSGLYTGCTADNMGYYTNVVRMMDWLRGKVTDLEFD
ncbi:complement factor B-like [Scyliorhinus torazame]